MFFSCLYHWRAVWPQESHPTRPEVSSSSLVMTLSFSTPFPWLSHQHQLPLEECALFRLGCWFDIESEGGCVCQAPGLCNLQSACKAKFELMTMGLVTITAVTILMPARNMIRQSGWAEEEKAGRSTERASKRTARNLLRRTSTSTYLEGRRCQSRGQEGELC